MPPFSNELVSRLAAASRVAVLTGAGISKESGVPTFRDADGLWQKFRPEELASIEAFLRNPVLVQGWYTHRRRILDDIEPNPGHRALAELQELVETRSGGSFLLVTQNVDNLHQEAGSRDVVELHGNIKRAYCIDCHRVASREELDAIQDDVEARCPGCQGLIRPDVVWFGEYLPQDAMERATEAAALADVFLSIGTSAVVYPAAGIPLVAADSGAYVAEINVEPSAIARAMNEVAIGPSGEVLPALVAAVREAEHGHDPVA
jgi:NAD-dependent deacetylase